MSKLAQHDGLPIIAIGASAGGLEACRVLLKEMPGAFPAAFILTVQPDPSHDSMMADLLAIHTQLKVVQAADRMTLEPGMVYVIPPGASLAVKQRVIHLSDPASGKDVRMPFDTLLRSLANEALPMACVVMSGTGTDGSLGLADFHAAGGLVVAQDPIEADCSGMPEAAIATGLVAQVLPASQMVVVLQEYVFGAVLPSAELTGEPPLPTVGDVQTTNPAIPRYDVLPDGRAGDEELQASREELQRQNEALSALNSQLQETLEAHRAAANDLQMVLNSTDLATLFLDSDLNIRFFTPAARAIFRVIPTDVGRPLEDLAVVARDDGLTADARQVLKTAEPIDREFAGRDGEWFTRRVQPYRSEGSGIKGVVITYINISERKRAKAALLSAKAEADRATKVNDRFLASMSHDLRQPLQSMALLQGLLNRSGGSAEGTRLAKLMDQTMNSMTAMLDSILDVNRIDSRTVYPDMRPVALGPLMERLADEFAPQCDARNLKMRFVPSKAWVQTDPQLLEQILRNLLSNALKFTTTGGILMGCRRSGDMLKVLVCDTGIGISAAESKSIFDPYRQVEKSQAVVGDGLGLGLSIVHRLVQLMDHTISVQSTPGRGSAFSIVVPIVSPAPEVARSMPTDADRPMVALQSGTILMVEDEEPLRQLLAEVLENQGYTVISKSDAQHALDWAMSNETRPDLLLTDLELRKSGNGLSLAEDLHEVLGGTLPTIILTGDITTQTRREIISCGFTQLVKPVRPKVLLSVISNLMLTARSADTRLVRRSKSSQTRVHVVDDDPMIRETMRRLFQSEGWNVATYPTAEHFMSAPRPAGVDCLLVDHALPGMDGVTLISQLRAEGSSVPAIILTGHGDAAMAVAALRAGAFDLIEKPSSAAELLASIRQAVTSVDNIRPQSDAHKAAQTRLERLTERERQVLSRVLAGVPNKIIAADLGINQRTVEHHRASVMRKTDVPSVPALVRLALAGKFKTS